MYTLENNFLKTSIHPKGAELQSIYHKAQQKEYMWSADEAYWGKHSPVLFPIIGSLKDDIYIHNNKTYTLPRHGFARDSAFSVAQQDDYSITFTLQENAASLVNYPFPFLLSITYTLVAHKLTCSYTVKNTGTAEMFFSIGAHPAFALAGNYEDYFLQFNKDEDLVRYKLVNGLISNVTETMVLTNQQLPLQHRLFYEDAIVLKNLQSNEIILHNQKDKTNLVFQFNDFPYFGIWAAKNAPFVCLEPWCGIADANTHNQQFATKEGIQKLAQQHTFTRSWSAECK